MAAPWYQRFLTSTRGRLIALLRRDTHTVDELAQRLDLTDNAVRAHLATLERDGLVQQCGVRRGPGSGKPAYAYELTPEAEQIFPKPYAAVLGELLAAMHEQLPHAEVEALLRESGRRLAERHSPASGGLRAKLATGAAALNQLGGLAEVEEHAGELGIHGYSCALAALAPSHPEICGLAEKFVSDVTGIAMREQCERGAKPHCYFAPATDSSPRGDGAIAQ